MGFYDLSLEWTSLPPLDIITIKCHCLTRNIRTHNGLCCFASLHVPFSLLARLSLLDHLARFKPQLHCFQRGVWGIAPELGSVLMFARTVKRGVKGCVRKETWPGPAEVTSSLHLPGSS